MTAACNHQTFLVQVRRHSEHWRKEVSFELLNFVQILLLQQFSLLFTYVSKNNETYQFD